MDFNIYKSIDNGNKVEITYPDGSKKIENINYDEYMEKLLIELSLSKPRKKKRD